ncbi:MAG: hypothetical protein QF554_14045 [Dehalococcoidia bacterium]|nr:hypothetical protein [Dehalococcoidia bacterium]
MEHEGPVIKLDVELGRQSVEPRQPDIAPRSDVVVPDGKRDRRVERLERWSLVEGHSETSGMAMLET